MNTKTRLAYWRYVLKQAFFSSFRRGLGLGFAIVVTVAIAIYQQLHHITIERDGLWAFLKPYVVELSAWFILQISESCWNFHKATLAAHNAELRRFGVARLTELATDGAFFFERACLPPKDANEFANCWVHLVRRWKDQTNKLILEYFGDQESKNFLRTGLVETDLQQSIPNVDAHAWAEHHNLKRWLENLNRLLGSL